MPGNARILTCAAIAGIACLSVSRVCAEGDLPCPPPDFPNTPIVNLPLSTYGRWTAIPQCTNLYAGNGNLPCADPQNDVFPRSLYSVHGVLAFDGRVALWKQTCGLSVTSSYAPRWITPDANDFAHFTTVGIPAFGPADCSVDLFCGGHTAMPDGRVLVGEEPTKLSTIPIVQRHARTPSLGRMPPPSSIQSAILGLRSHRCNCRCRIQAPTGAAGIRR